MVLVHTLVILGYFGLLVKMGGKGYKVVDASE